MTFLRAGVFIGAALTLLVGATPALAQRTTRSTSRTSVNVNHNTNVNRNTNVTVNRNVNVNRDVDIRTGGAYYGGGCCYHPVATAAAVTATVAVTAAVIGSVVHSLPPACTDVMVSGLTYQQCGTTWYQPQFVGTTTSYVVVTAPT